MVATRKQDGSLKRTVDLYTFNEFFKKETHSAETPFHLARRISHNLWKTVTDVWNGYHIVQLWEEDRNLTTFITDDATPVHQKGFIHRWRV